MFSGLFACVLLCGRPLHPYIEQNKGKEGVNGRQNSTRSLPAKAYRGWAFAYNLSVLPNETTRLPQGKTSFLYPNGTINFDPTFAGGSSKAAALAQRGGE